MKEAVGRRSSAMLPEDINRMIEDIEEALDADELVRALSLLDQLHAAGEQVGAVHLLRAKVLSAMGKHQLALPEAEQARKLLPDNEHAQLLVARSAWHTRAMGKAQAAFERAIKLSGQEPELLAEYATFMAWERGPRPAELAARAALAANERSADAWAALGLAQHRMHRNDVAETSLKRALQLDPNNSMAQSAMVLLLRDQHQDTKAAALVEVMQDEPTNAGFVEAMRKDLNQRKAVRKLLERPEVQAELMRERGLPHRTVAWLMVLFVIAANSGLAWYLCRAAKSSQPAWAVALIAILLAWLVRRMFGK